MQHFKHFKRKKNLEFGTFWINFEMRNPNGLTPLHFECINGQIEIVQLFIYFIFGIKIQRRLFWGWFQTIVNSTQDSFLQLCQFSWIIIKLWNLMKKSIFSHPKKSWVILLLRPIYGGTLCILNESWCNVKIRFTCCMTAILIFRYHIRPPYT
mgnify:CR=1 FL=1